MYPPAAQRVFKPESMSFNAARAHGGAADIEFCRFASRSQGSLFDHMDYVYIKPGSDIGFHVHEKDEEVYIVLEGSGRMNLDGSETPVKKGDVIINPPGGGHGLVNDSNTIMILLVIQCSDHMPSRDPKGLGE